MSINYQELKNYINDYRLYKKECDDQFKEISKCIDYLTPENKHYDKKDELLKQKEIFRHNKHYASMVLKYHIYAYNKDLTNMEKQHKKLTEYELQDIEEMMDDTTKVDCAIHSVNKKKQVEQGTGEGALIMVSDVLKANYKGRSDMIEITKKL